MTNTRLRLTPSEFGALWTFLQSGGMFYVDYEHVKPFEWHGIEKLTPEFVMGKLEMELIEEHNPDFRPRYENGVLTVDPLFRMWVSTLDSPATQRLLRAIQ